MESKTVTLKITSVDTFIFEDGVRVEFFPISDTPGCTHRVYILKAFQLVAKDWFAPTYAIKSPGKKAALFYYTKHGVAIQRFQNGKQGAV